MQILKQKTYNWKFSVKLEFLLHVYILNLNGGDNSSQVEYFIPEFHW